eukprot:TRINITY_DN12207_c1_g1_i2.p1 TRINITY_DN12207_c1_g1~~TRINITY_DN12207_c1_g1_i2.p1  ORF type:complete len:118 (+),score=0.07 TRINITY_DN12207_c1_g1_i2:359-712(+)
MDHSCVRICENLGSYRGLDAGHNENENDLTSMEADHLCHDHVLISGSRDNRCPVTKVHDIAIGLHAPLLKVGVFKAAASYYKFFFDRMPLAPVGRFINGQMASCTRTTSVSVRPRYP